MDAAGAARVPRALLKDLRRQSRAAARKILTRMANASLVAREPHVLSGNPPPSAFLRELDRHLRLHPRGAVAVLAGSRPSSLAAHVARAFPDVRLVEVDAKKSASALHAFLAAHGPFHIIAADAIWLRRRRLFVNVFFHLTLGGVLVMRVPQHRLAGVEAVKELVPRILQGQRSHGGNTAWTRLHAAGLDEAGLDEARLDESIGEVILERSHLVVTSKVRALAKMTEAEVNTVLEQRAGQSGRILDKRTGSTWMSRCDVRTSDSTTEPRMPKSYRAPDMFLREYYHAVCLPRQIAVQENLILPDSYRHNQQRPLTHGLMNDYSARFARPIADVGATTTLTGAYFYLDSEFPGHFGHTMTDQMSRLWAWEQAKRVEPDLRVLRSLPRPGAKIHAHELEIYHSIGIEGADVVLFDAAIEVERLVAATPMFSMPDYVHPDIRAVWNTIGSRLAASAPKREYARRIFCSRRTTKRQCRNALEVESVFADQGFQVIYPEDFPLPEQAAMFRHADIVAGYAGSAMFSLAFCETPKLVIMITSEIYRARNEYMICSVLGHQLKVLWCRPDAHQVANTWPEPGRKTAFTFDFAREGLFLKDTLASL